MRSFQRACAALRGKDPKSGKTIFAICRRRRSWRPSIVIARGVGLRRCLHLHRRAGDFLDERVFSGSLLRAEIPPSCGTYKRVGRPGMRPDSSRPTCSSCALSSHGDTKHLCCSRPHSGRVLEFGRNIVRPGRNSRPGHSHERCWISGMKTTGLVAGRLTWDDRLKTRAAGAVLSPTNRETWATPRYRPTRTSTS